MLKYASRRIAATVPILFTVVTLVFIVLRLGPGGPAYAILGADASAATVAALNERLGLDQPAWKQYLDFWAGLLQFDLGKSLFNGQPVISQLTGAFPYTASLVIGTIIVGLIIGIPIGIITALGRNTILDYAGRIISLAGLSIPEFYLAVLMILFFSVNLGWLPMTGGGSLEDPADFLKRLILPSLTIGVIMSSFVSRTVRAAMLDILPADFIRTAKAKGLAGLRIIIKHAFRNALLPTVAFLGIYMASLLGGTVVIEVVFARRGWGRILVNAMNQYDYPVIQGGILAFTIIVVLVNLAVDLVYAWVDPRIAYS